MSNKKTLVIGASTKPDRYAYKAAKQLLAHGHSIELLGNKTGSIDNNEIFITPKPIENIDTITLYVNPTNQQPLYNYILDLNPKRIVFNPGTENPELEKMAATKGIETVEACTLVMLSIGNY
jgi:hypothetical protein